VPDVAEMNCRSTARDRDRAEGRWTPKSLLIASLAVAGFGWMAPPAGAASLRGSRGAMDQQVRVARQNDYTFFETAAELRQSADEGELVQVSDGRDYELSGVSFPYALPELLLLIERLSGQYRDACGEKLVVTSLARPKSLQPSNASPRSVHQAGMAMDVRRSRRSKCRRWLEGTIVTLERRGVAEATYEARPPHYHVAVFPEAYRNYVQRKLGGGGGGGGGGGDAVRSHLVDPGDTLWGLARRYRTSVSSLRTVNELRSDVLRPGQLLRIPN
jgi:nucleoid-associated protein YgaU